VLKPYLRGRDVKRWRVEYADLWLLYIPWHFPLHLDSSIKGASKKAEGLLAKQYPAIFEHLRGFKKELSARNIAETGIRYEWYALQRWGADYWKEFEQPKIITGRFMDKPTFAYDEGNHYNNNANSFIAGANPMLAGVLNSSVTWYYLRNTCTDLQNGFLQAHNENIAEIPIPIGSPPEQSEMEKLVRRIVKTRSDSSDVLALETEVNDRVYRLFSLTRDEIKLVEETK
jgi:hypothetical protein